MEELERAELKDKVLAFLIEKGGAWRPKELFVGLGKPLKSQAHFVELLNEMANVFPKFIDTTHNKSNGNVIIIARNNFTSELLENGGFVNQYKSDEEADREAEKLSTQEQSTKDLQEENLRLTNKLTKNRIKTHWLPIAISIISLGFAVYPRLFPTQKVSQEEINIQLKKMDEKIEQLRLDFKKETDSLKNELYEAEMLISVYEEKSD